MSLFINNETDILAVIDVQNDFLPGGELAVPNGDEILPVIKNLIDRNFIRSFATQDWHPHGHISFASSHTDSKVFDSIFVEGERQILWPDHAVQNTFGADFPALFPQHKCQMILRKGWHKGIDSYSAFQENDRKTPTGLTGWLKENGVKRIFFTGLAEDFCVAYSAEDAVLAGFESYIIEDATRPVGLVLDDGTTTAIHAREKLQALGVTYIKSTVLVSK